jgi:hypothetical protein
VEAISSEPEVDDWSELPRLDDDVHQRSKKGVSSKMKKSHRVPKNWTPEKGSRRTKKAGAAREHEPITIARLERTLTLAAYIVSIDGAKAVPIFERLEREYEAARANQNTVSRAKRLLETYGGTTEHRAIAPPA